MPCHKKCFSDIEFSEWWIKKIKIRIEQKGDIEDEKHLFTEHDKDATKSFSIFY